MGVREFVPYPGGTQKGVASFYMTESQINIIKDELTEDHAQEILQGVM